MAGQRRDLEVRIRTVGAEVLKQSFSGVQTALQKFDSALGVVGRRILGFIGFRALKRQADDSVDAFSSLQESINAVEVVFGNASDTILDFAGKAAKAAGLSKSEFNQMSAEIGAMLIGFGLDAEEAADQTLVLAQRAADLASVYNTDVSQALNAIQSGLQRQIRPLRQYAINLEDARVKQKAVDLGLADSTASVDLNADAQARLALIMEQSEIVAGDFVRTSGDFANAMRISNSEIENQQAAIGQALVPAYQGLKPVMVEAAGAFAVIALELAKSLNLIDEVDAMLARLELQTGQNRDSVAVLAGSLVEMSDELRVSKDELDGFKEGQKRTAVASRDFAFEMNKVINASGATAETLKKVRDGLPELVDKFGLAQDEADELAVVLDAKLAQAAEGVRLEMLNALPVMGDFDFRTQQIRRSTEEAAIAAQEWREEILRLADPIFDAAKAAEEADDAHRAWVESVKEFGQDSPEATQAAMDYALALAQARAAGGKIDEEARGAFRRIMLDAGLAIEMVEALIRALEALTTGETIPGTPGTTIPLPGGNFISAFHEGGTVPGTPGTDVLIRAQAGEEITRRSETTNGHSGSLVNVYVTDPSVELLDELAELGRRGIA